MPNHCVSTLYLRSEPKNLNKLLKQVEITESEASEAHPASKFSFHQIIPMPVKEESNWYEWCISNWGTKWDICDTDMTGSWENGEVGITFWTAWSPVHQVLLTLSQQNPKVDMTYTYYDEGGGFYGTYHFFDGEMIKEEEGGNETWTCEIFDKYWGEDSTHHSCAECYDYVNCEKDKTPALCESCQEQEQQLWDKEKEKLNV